MQCMQTTGLLLVTETFLKDLCKVTITILGLKEYVLVVVLAQANQDMSTPTT